MGLQAVPLTVGNYLFRHRNRLKHFGTTDGTAMLFVLVECSSESIFAKVQPE